MSELVCDSKEAAKMMPVPIVVKKDGYAVGFDTNGAPLFRVPEKELEEETA